ncbi:hypothetical protein LNKW23_43720 [Paralimibaculum aggregatum]|uniref:Uncharacterized protein n=1 Tax=Paralimibaculum aggregatum TaxID=3036245 RepID=A0ABQ6LSV9_9RHOB|nr:hypothetical protein LNKW23_43720 [Limibaculum sp. NKW23]
MHAAVHDAADVAATEAVVLEPVAFNILANSMGLARHGSTLETAP